MKKVGVILFLTALGAAVIVGCEKENKVPYFTRLHASSSCGVAPFSVEFKATATGGDPLDQPTGGNNWLEISWDFGDGATGTGSITYHTFNDTGTYNVTVEAKDVDGDISDPPGLIVIDVRPDTLMIQAEAQVDSQPATSVFACDTVQFNVFAKTCGFDPVTGDYFRFLYTWDMDDTTATNDTSTVYRGRSPKHTYLLEHAGNRLVNLTLVDPGTSVLRADIVPIEILTASADIGVTTEVDNATPRELDTINYTITVTNSGPDNSVGIKITDQIPNGLTYLDNNPSQGSYDADESVWSVGDIANGASATLVVTVRVNDETVGAILRYRARLTAVRRCDENSSNDNDSVNITIIE